MGYEKARAYFREPGKQVVQILPRLSSCDRTVRMVAHALDPTAAAARAKRCGPPRLPRRLAWEQGFASHADRMAYPPMSLIGAAHRVGD